MKGCFLKERGFSLRKGSSSSSIGSMPVGVQFPISSSLGEVPAIGIGSGVLGARPYWCPSPFPSLSILGFFHSLLSAIGYQSCFFFTAVVSPPIRSTLHLLTF